MSFLSRLSMFLALAFLAFHAAARPFNVTERDTGLATRDVPAAPHWVIYTDAWVSGETGPPAASTVAVSELLMIVSDALLIGGQGFNVV